MNHNKNRRPKWVEFKAGNKNVATLMLPSSVCYFLLILSTEVQTEAADIPLEGSTKISVKLRGLRERINNMK